MTERRLPKITIDQHDVIRIDGVVFAPYVPPKPPATERLGQWLVSGAERGVERLGDHARLLGRIVAYGAPLLAVGGAALGIPPGVITAVTTAAKVVTGGVDLPACE